MSNEEITFKIEMDIAHVATVDAPYLFWVRRFRDQKQRHTADRSLNTIDQTMMSIHDPIYLMEHTIKWELSFLYVMGLSGFDNGIVSQYIESTP